MSTLGTIVYALAVIVAISSWVVAMINYRRLRLQAKLGFWEAYYSFAVYRYALSEARGSRETKLMFGGFLGMFVFLFGGGMLAGALSSIH